MDKLFKFPVINIIIIGIITLFFLLLIPNLKIDNNVEIFVPENNKSKVAYNEMGNDFGSSDMIFVVVKTNKKNIFDKDYINTIYDISNQCERIVYNGNNKKKFYDSINLFKKFSKKNIHYEDDKKQIKDENETKDNGIDDILNEFDDSEDKSNENANDLLNLDDFNITSEEDANDINNEDIRDQTKNEMILMKGDSLVDDVISITNSDYIEGKEHELISEPLLDNYCESEEEVKNLKSKIFSWDIYKDNLYSKDLKSSAIVIKLRADTTTQHHKEVYQKVSKIIKPYKKSELEFYISGLSAITVLVGDYMRKDIIVLIPLVFLVILFSLYFSFKRLGGVILPALTVLISTIWALGLMSLLGRSITIIATTIPIILIAAGSAYGIHLITHYYDEIKNQKVVNNRDKHKKLVTDLVKKIGLPIFLAAITTVIGFISLVSSPIDPLKDFGIFTSIGIASAFIISVILIPSLLMLKHSGLKITGGDMTLAKESKVVSVMMGLFHYLSLKGHRILFLSAIIIIISIFGITKVKIDGQLVKFFKNDSGIKKADIFINDNYAGTNVLNIKIKGENDGDLTDPDILIAMDNLSEFLQNKYKKDIGKIIGFQDYIKRMNQVLNYPEDNFESEFISKKELLESLNAASINIADENADAKGLINALNRLYNYKGRNFYEIPYDLKKYGLSDSKDLQKLISQYLFLYSGSLDDYAANDAIQPVMAKMSILMKSSSGELVENISRDIKTYVEKYFPEKYSVIIAGSSDLQREVNNLIVTSQVWSLAISLLAIFIIVAISFRSIVAGLIGCIPLSLAILINFGIMGFFKIDLNIATATIASIAVGIGVDYTIHFLSEYKHQRKLSDDLDIVTKNTLVTTGKAIVFNAVSIIFGFAVLIFSSFIPLINFGVLVIIIMGTSSLGALLILPAILNIFKPKFVLK